LEWRDWNRTDWNDALVEATFQQSAHSSPAIRRIDSTSQYLARVVNASAKDSESVRQAFVSCFKGPTYEIKRLFDYTRQTHRWTPKSKKLPFFAQLYLSVLVASADATTYEMGNFRERLTASLGLTRDPLFYLGDLAALWEAAALWTKRSESTGLRLLQLPDPRHETIIGYAKGLAFPAYRDQLRLSEILATRKLHSDSPINLVQAAVEAARAKFSDWFNDEYRIFSGYVGRGDKQAAIRTPFWAAVMDISWEHRPSDAARAGVTFQLELDIVDPYEASVQLLSDRLPALQRSSWKVVEGEHSFGQFVLRIVHQSNDAQVLTHLAKADGLQLLGRDALARAIRDGCIFFTRDAFGRWVADNGPQDGDAFWLLVTRAHQDKVHRSLVSAGSQPDYAFPFSGGAWSLCGPINWNESVRTTLLRAMPHVDVVQLRLRMLSMKVQGGIRLPEGYLFLPPVLPKVAMSGASTVSWRARYSDDEQIGPFEMVQEANGEQFAIRSHDARNVCKAALISFDARDEEDAKLAVAAVEAVQVCRSSQLKQPANPKRWLETGIDGQLGEASATSPDTRPIDTVDSPEASQFTALRPVSLDDQRESIDLPVVIPLEDLSAPWKVALEVLAATFVRSAVISQRDFFDLIQRLWNLDARGTWSRIDDLLQNGLIRQLFSRQWHGSVYVACPPELFALETADGFRIRVVGLVHDVVRRALLDAVTPWASTCTAIVSDSDQAGLGCIELTVSRREGVEEIARRAQLPVRFADSLESICFPSWAQILFSEPHAPRGERSLWVDEAGAFLEPRSGADQKGALERWRQEGLQDVYVVKVGQLKWTTQSRTWALLGRAALSKGFIGTIVNGTLVLEPRLLLPGAGSSLAMRWGGGISYLDTQGRRLYPGSAVWSAARLLSNWLAPRRPGDHARGFERLNIALGNRLKLHPNTRLNWYGVRR
jgi:hypothetical protein